MQSKTLPIENRTKKVKISSIKSLGTKTTANLTVEKNHTFITKNGIVTHNCDSLSPLAQRILRGEIEKFHDSARFVLTANYGNKIIPALHSRCQGFHFEALDMGEFTVRVGEILVKENVEFDIDTLQEFVNLTYPDLRKCINLLQQSTGEGVLHKPEKTDSGGKDYLFDMVKLFQEGKLLEARKMIVSQAEPEEYPEIYKWFYQNLEIWGDTEEKQNEALLIIRKGLVNHALVGDGEINLAATICELTNLLR